MNIGLFLSNSSSRCFLGVRSRRVVTIFLAWAFVLFSLCAFGYAQDRGTGTSDDVSFDRFLTGAYSEKSKTTTNASRPPKPKQTLEGLFYPDGFLTLSKPSPEPGELLLEKKGSLDSEPSTENAPVVKSDEKSSRFLDPGLETTPYVPPLDRTKEENNKKGRLFFIAFSIALAALGLFVFFDYRYREQLRLDLERNARLSSPQAVSADFVDFPPGALDVPIQLPQRNSYESEDYRYGLNGDVGAVSILQDVEDDAERSETNFDFTPQGNDGSDASLEPQEDFVVSETDE